MHITLTEREIRASILATLNEEVNSDLNLDNVLLTYSETGVNIQAIITYTPNNLRTSE